MPCCAVACWTCLYNLMLMLNVLLLSCFPCFHTQYWRISPSPFSLWSMLMMAMHLSNLKVASRKPHAALQVDFVHVSGWYRVGKLLGSGGSGEPNYNLSSMLCHASLGSVYLGRDIRTGAKVALKIGSMGPLPSGLNHKHNVYLNIAGSTGPSLVLWYGKEGWHQVIILEYLGNSLGDLVNEKCLDCEKVFSYALQMVCLWCL